MKRLLTAILSIPVTLVTFAVATAPVQAAEPATHLVISEVHTNQAGTEEFIELYNPTNTAIDLEALGLKLHIRDAAGAAANAPLLFLEDTIPAHGYFLIAHRGSGYVADADALYEFSPSVSQLTDNGSVAISTSATPGQNVIDMVGWGTQPNGGYEKAPFTPNADPTQSIERRPGSLMPTAGNGIDTNDNSADFVLRTSVEPQNSDSPAEKPYDNEAPKTRIVSPAPSSYIATNSPLLEVNLSDPSGLQYARLIRNGEYVADLTWDANGKATYQFNNLSEGTHNLTVRVADARGNEGDTSWTFYVDTVAPVVSIDLPAVVTGFVTPVKLQLHGQTDDVVDMQVSIDQFDTEGWQPFRASFEQNLARQEGRQTIIVRVRDRAGNVSEVAANGVVVDLPALGTPSDVISTTTTNKVTLTWSAVPGAAGYLVRYSDGTTLYGPFRTGLTSMEINNLDPSKAYRFEVATINEVNETTTYRPAVTADVAAAEAAARAAAEAAAAMPTGGPETIPADEIAQTTNRAPRTTVSPSPSPSVSPSPSPSASPEVKADSDENNIDWTRILVALSILIIAAGVATGGWYLYQWWISRPTNGKGGRW